MPCATGIHPSLSVRLTPRAMERNGVDAKAGDIRHGDLVGVFNDRGIVMTRLEEGFRAGRLQESVSVVRLASEQ